MSSSPVRRIQPQPWRTFKAKVVRQGKTLTQLQSEVPATLRALQVAVIEKRFPRVRRRLVEMGYLTAGPAAPKL